MVKSTKQILEAIQRGINLAIDDFNDELDIETQKTGQIRHSQNTRELIRDKYFVDLELPSGILWAKYNIGVDPTKLNMAQDWYGGYYAWGEIEEKRYYGWKNYKYANGDYYNLTKYCNDVTHCDESYKPDNLTTLQDEDDVAVQTNKFPWTVKMPTKEQFEELIIYTTNKWVENYHDITGLNGRVFTSKQNGNEIFIPAAGYLGGSLVNDFSSYCFMWSSSLNQDESGSAYFLFFYSVGYQLNINPRYGGFSVRAVLIK